MTDSMELHAMLVRHAKSALAHGVTPEEMEARANEQDSTGFSVSAPYTRCIASFMRDLAKRKEDN